MKRAAFFEGAAKASVYALVVLFPLWVLPVTPNISGYQKQVLLAALTVVGCIAWIAGMVYGGEIRFRFSWLHVFALSMPGAVGISTVFSKWPYASFWGWPLDVSDSFLALLAFFLLYLLVSQSLQSVGQLALALAGLTAAGALAVGFTVLQLKELFVLPFSFAQSAGFNTLGSASGAAMLAAALLPVSLGLSWASVFRDKKKAYAFQWGLRATALALFVWLMMLDFLSAWVVAMVGLAALFVFELMPARGQAAGKISVPLMLLLVSLFFVLMGDFAIPGAPVKQLEATPDYRGELAIVRGVLSENPLYGVFGTGPGTFALDYAKHRPISVNEGVFWSTRFASGRSEAADWLITKGTVGVFALVLFIGFAMWRLAGRLLRFGRKEQHEGAFVLGSAVFASLTALLVALALYPANFVLWFVFWMVAGSAGFFAGKRMRAPLRAARPMIGVAVSGALMAVVVGGLGLAVIGGQKYAAEVEYLRGLRAVASGQEERAIEKIQSAANLNPSMDVYRRDLARLYVSRANQIAGDQSLPGEVRQQQLRAAVSGAAESAKKAVEAGPEHVPNWNVQGFVYRSLIGLAIDAEKFAAESYEKARELEPSSPFPWTELGRVKILQAQLSAGLEESESRELLARAVLDLEKAVELKEDYAPAHYLLAVAYGEQGNEEQAVRKLEETSLKAPDDVGVMFQLGVVYYRQNQFGKAGDAFERAKALNERYSNARYMLGLTYDRLGRVQDARAEFSAVSALNPENQEIKNILSNLSLGLPAFPETGPQAVEPPIEDSPPEIESEGQ